MRSVRELIKLSTEYLEKKGVAHARREAEELLAALLNRKRLELYFDYDAPLEEGEVTKYREWIKRKGEKEPLAYIIGEVGFLDLKLKVTSSTLIPRHETEIFADLILKKLPEMPLEIWDICCGTGCLGLAIKSKRPSSHVRLSDISKEALEIAHTNAQLNGLEVDLLEGDLLTPYTGSKADVIICNPPYVTTEEYEMLEEEVRLFEPKGALVGGLEFYQRFAAELPPFLNEGAKLFFEIGKNQKDALMEIFSKSHWKQKHCEKDWGGHDRFFFLEYHRNFG